MSWPDSKAAVFILYNHIFHNFDKIWEFLVFNFPKSTIHFLSFGIVGFEAIQSKDSSKK